LFLAKTTYFTLLNAFFLLGKIASQSALIYFNQGFLVVGTCTHNAAFAFKETPQ
jgi:hypothetical protein